MKLRRDAAAAMAEAMVYVRKMAEGLSLQNDGYFVATVGVVEVQPNGANVVPESARMVIDVRAENRDVMERFASALDTTTAAIAAAYRVDRDGPNILSDSMPSRCNTELRNLLGQCAKDMRLSTRDLASGAGHDCAFISKIAPAAMVLVPCRKGKSHASKNGQSQMHWQKAPTSSPKQSCASTAKASCLIPHMAWTVLLAKAK